MADRRPAAALLLALLLAGCSAGVPPTGKVETVNEVLPAPSSRQPVDSPGPPADGLTEREVADGFMKAMSTGEPAIAQPWVVRDTRALARMATWDERVARANVYEKFPEPRPPVQQGGRTVVRVAVELLGTVSQGRSWTPYAGQATLDLELRQDGGEWRVADPPEVPWMSAADFAQRHRRTEVFLVVPDRGHLTPVPVYVPRRPRRNADAVQAAVDAAVRALLEGPGRLQGTLFTAIPVGTSLGSVSVRGDLVTVNLSEEFRGPEGGSGSLRVGQVVWTVTQLVTTAQVELRVGGRPAGLVGVDRFNADRRWRRSTPPLGSLWPQRGGNPKGMLFVRRGTIALVPGLEGAPPGNLYPPLGEASAPTWAPDGSQTAFLARKGKGPMVLYLGSASGRPARTGLEGELSAPSWTPSRARPRVLVLRRAQGAVELWSVDPDRSHRPVRLGLARLPKGLLPTTLRVSPDGAFALAVGAGARAHFGDGGQLFLGLLSESGVKEWVPAPIAPTAAFGEVYSPIWIDPATVAFLAKRRSPQQDPGEIWIMAGDGWQPAMVDLNRDQVSEQTLSLGEHLTVDPSGEALVFTRRSAEGTSLWTVKRDGRGLRLAVDPAPDYADSDPGFASR